MFNQTPFSGPASGTAEELRAEKLSAEHTEKRVCTEGRCMKRLTSRQKILFGVYAMLLAMAGDYLLGFGTSVMSTPQF